MLQYLIILLDDTSVSYCHYENKCLKPNLMPLDILREGILYGMKENLMIQFVYPSYDLPQEYKDVIETIDHTKIVPFNTNAEDADIVVYKDVNILATDTIEYSKTIVLRISKTQLFENEKNIGTIIGKVKRLNLILTDLDNFNEYDYKKYKDILSSWNTVLSEIYTKGNRPQFNLITDRIMLNSMNNCGAGNNSITLAPDGKFYVCPAFYHVANEDDYGLGKIKFSIGSLKDGLSIKNPQLYKLEYAPICRECDAFQCKRCIWLNRNMTYEVNTPSKQQCVISHIERNASRELLEVLKCKIGYMPTKIIEDIEYYDPFDKLMNK